MERLRFYLMLLCPENDLDKVVHILRSFKNDKCNYYVDFYGHILESDTVTLEDAYQKIYGMTKEQIKSKNKVYQKIK